MKITEFFIDSLHEFGKELSEEVIVIQNQKGIVSYKEDKSPLTIADIHSNARIRQFLQENSDVKNIISEEDKEVNFKERSKWNYYWLIDPIDGTKEFVKGGDDFCINIALCKGSEPIFGYVACPRKQNQYYAIKGCGAFKNKSRIYSKYSINPSEKKVKVVASKSHMNAATEAFIKKVELHHEVETLNIGSSLKFCIIAEGGADVYPRFGPTMEWDTAAPQIIAEESGAVVHIAKGESTGKRMQYNKENLLNPFFIVSSPHFEVPVSN